MDTLRGSLDTFGLSDVVKLISASGKTGLLTAESFQLKGRIFLAEGVINYATTRGDDGDIEELTAMSAASQVALDERRGRKETTTSQTLEDLVEQQVVEVFVRLIRMQGGKFAFDEGTRTKAYGNGAVLSLDVDKILEQAIGRIEEWEDIETVVPSSSTRFGLNGDLGGDAFEITLDARSWTFLAAIGHEASVQDLAARLRIFEFPAAKKVAEFVRRGLLVPTKPPAKAAPVRVTADEAASTAQPEAGDQILTPLEPQLPHPSPEPPRLSGDVPPPPPLPPGVIDPEPAGSVD